MSNNPKKKVEKAKTPMEELLGDSLATNVKGGKTPTATAFKGKDLVALYFSAKVRKEQNVVPFFLIFSHAVCVPGTDCI